MDGINKLLEECSSSMSLLSLGVGLGKDQDRENEDEVPEDIEDAYDEEFEQFLSANIHHMSRKMNAISISQNLPNKPADDSAVDETDNTAPSREKEEDEEVHSVPSAIGDEDLLYGDDFEESTNFRKSAKLADTKKKEQAGLASPLLTKDAAAITSPPPTAAVAATDPCLLLSTEDDWLESHDPVKEFLHAAITSSPAQNIANEAPLLESATASITDSPKLQLSIMSKIAVVPAANSVNVDTKAPNAVIAGISSKLVSGILGPLSSAKVQVVSSPPRDDFSSRQKLTPLQLDHPKPAEVQPTSPEMKIEPSKFAESRRLEVALITSNEMVQKQHLERPRSSTKSIAVATFATDGSSAEVSRPRSAPPGRASSANSSGKDKKVGTSVRVSSSANLRQKVMKQRDAAFLTQVPDESQFSPGRSRRDNNDSRKSISRREVAEEPLMKSARFGGKFWPFMPTSQEMNMIHASNIKPVYSERMKSLNAFQNYLADKVPHFEFISKRYEMILSFCAEQSCRRTY
jgi:hypothetical protein